MAGFICRDDLTNAVVFMESRPQWSYNVFGDCSMRASIAYLETGTGFGDLQV